MLKDQDNIYTIMLVSVVIPCYNAENHIERCLDSVFSQTYSNLEVIVVDNNSTDNTLSVLNEYQEKTNYDFTILSENKQGAPAARNLGLKHAKGDYIQFLDADDALAPEKIKKQGNKIILSGDRPNFVVGNFIKKHSGGKSITIKSEISDPFCALLKSKLGNTCSNLWEKASLLKINGWNENLRSSQEADLMFRLLQNGAKVLHTEEFDTIIHVTKGSISNTNIEDNWKRYIDLRSEILDYLKTNELLWSNREKAAYDGIFSALRSLFKKNPSLAYFYYKKYIPNNYSPEHYSKIYLMIYKLLGFRVTERLRNISLILILIYFVSKSSVLS